MSNDFSIDIDRFGRLHLDDAFGGITDGAVSIRVRNTPTESVVSVRGHVSSTNAQGVRDVVTWLSDSREQPLLLDLSSATVDDLAGLLLAACPDTKAMIAA